jgi:hypothetical protein
MRHNTFRKLVNVLEFIIKCGKCGESATFKDGDSKNRGEIDLITSWSDNEIQIWCDKCNEYITIQ